MKAEIISVGTELLLGSIVNTNARYLSEQCAKIGLSLFYQTSVGDNDERLGEVLMTALKRSDVILVTGGLGPTDDDMTKETTARILGRDLVEDQHTRKNLKKFFEKRKHVQITDNNWKQAMVINGCKVIDNPNGTAPAMIVETDAKKHIVLLPGPPHEMKPLFDEHIAPFLDQMVPEVICSTTVKLCGLGESRVETQIKDLIDGQSNPTIATYAKIGEVHIRVTAKAESKKEANKLIDPVVKDITKRFDKHVFSCDENETLEEVVCKLLRNYELTLATAESCTGGMLAAQMINVSGVSDIFQGGVVAYANREKRRMLGVKKDTLKKYGAVSKKVAKEMAMGAAMNLNVDAALSTTGVAGPSGGTEDKPVGLVYIGCYFNGELSVEEFHFAGDRQKVREYTVTHAMDILRRKLLEYQNKKSEKKEK